MMIKKRCITQSFKFLNQANQVFWFSGTLWVGNMYLLSLLLLKNTMKSNKYVEARYIYYLRY